MTISAKWLRPVKQRMRGNSGETLSSTYSRTVNGRGKPKISGMLLHNARGPLSQAVPLRLLSVFGGSGGPPPKIDPIPRQSRPTREDPVVG